MDKNLTSTPPKKIGFSEKGVMDQVRKERTEAPEKTPYEIVKADLTRSGNADKADEYYAGLIEGTNQNIVRVMRNGNSLLVVQITAPGEATIDLLHDTTPKEIINNSIEFAKALKVANYKKVKLMAEPSKVGKLAKIAAEAAGWKYKVSPQPSGEYLVEWEA